jgi:hypothetical protein
MPITKADIIPKSDYRVSSAALANKVVANDINELKRVTDETVDALARAYSGFYVCNGAASQNITTGAEVTINQWTTLQPQDLFEAEAGDQYLDIPQAGVYWVSLEISYETTSKDDEIFKFWVTEDGNPIPGLCTRVQHHEPDVQVYQMTTTRLVAFDEGARLAARVDAEGTLDGIRTFDMKHGSLTVVQVG